MTTRNTDNHGAYFTMMRYTALIVLIIVIWTSCQPANIDFNPFDDEFRFHRSFNLTEYDTVIGECGYWNLTKQNGGLKIYYQFYLDERDIVAKGFQLDLDEIQFNNEGKSGDQSILEVFKTRPLDMDMDMIHQRLSVFGIKKINILPDTTSLIGMELVAVDGRVYYASVVPYYHQNKVLRCIDFFNGKDN